MKSFNLKYFIFLFSAFLILILSIPAVIYLYEKSDLPVTVHSSGNALIIKSIRNNTPLKVNDELISINGMPLTSREDIEMVMDSKRAGEKVIVETRSFGVVSETEVTSIRFYSDLFIIFQSFTALYFILFGLFVLIKARGNKAAELFYFASIGTTVIMIMTWGNYGNSFDLSYVTRSIFHIAYVITPILFVHFGLTFPQDHSAKYRTFLYGLYAIGLLIAVYNIYAFFRLTENLDSENISSFINAFNISRIFLAFCVLLSITIFFVGYIKSEDVVQKKKLKWLITGFLTGPLSFIALWVIPQALTDYGFIPEEFVSLLMLAVPLTFTISILKYQLLDIDFIINRSLIYSLVVAGIFLIYFAIVLSISWFIQDVNKTFLSSISAVMAAFLFNPLKNYVHNFVNKKFFRVQYNFRTAVKSFFSEMKEIYDINELADKIISGANRFIPVEKIALIDVSDIYSPNILSWINFSDSDLTFLKNKIFSKYDLKTGILSPDKVDSGGDPFEHDPSLKKVKIDLILTADPVPDSMQLILVTGNKKSGSRYYAEDIDLLQNILTTSAAVMARLKLQEDLIRKDLEAKQLKELNEQRSLFVSTVSHDLKTPLTSIRMYSELIKMNDDINKEKVNNYAGYIEGESERLTRLINNVLNFSSIEKGIKEYHKSTVDLNELVRQSVCIMEYQLKLKNFIVITDIAESEMLVYADPDALIELFLNLISNSIKYSLEKKEMLVKTFEENSSYIAVFSDSGIGIREEEQAKLFTPFFRSTEAEVLKIGGTGLGLSIVKHIADAHNISIDVDSRINNGTKIKLTIPKFQGR